MLLCLIGRLRRRLVDESFFCFLLLSLRMRQWLGEVILRLSPSYIQARPDGFPVNRHWPDKYEVVNSLATIADLRWP